MALLNPRPRAVNPIPIEPETPWDLEQRKLLGVRVGRTYAKPAQPTATSVAGSAAVRGTRVGGGGRISGGGGVIPTSRPLPAKP